MSETMQRSETPMFDRYVLFSYLADSRTPRPEYTFPPSSRNPAHRLSTSGRSRRPSPLLHEIQPPTRRLSSHQVLLLTPFGSPIPDASDMRRGSSSMGNRSREYSMGVSPSSLGPTSMSMGREPSQGVALPPPRALAPRVRHSFAAPTPSPLSHPLTTIQSTSETSSATPSREASDHGPEELEVVAIGTVAMTRSNSLPVLTLRELEAMKEKDEELGIARGSGWVWVDQEDTPGLENIPSASTSTLSLATTPPRPFAFNDPFASAKPEGTFRRRDETAKFGTFRPVATTEVEGYSYSPSSQIDRRASDAPPISNASPRSKLPDSRRPSAPISIETPRAPLSGLESPRGSQISPIRPRITRYKTSPARSQGLGLSINIRTEDQGSLGRKSVVSLSTVERRERRHARLRANEDVQDFGERRGSWAPVEVVDGVEADSIFSDDSIRLSTSSGSSRRQGSTSSRHVILLESTRAMSLSEFGATPSVKAEACRNRFDSLDSALPAKLSPSGYIPPIQSDWGEGKFDTFPRRASGILNQVGGGVLGLWKKKMGSKGRGSLGDVQGNEWYQRRGSWAEGWKE